MRNTVEKNGTATSGKPVEVSAHDHQCSPSAEEETNPPGCLDCLVGRALKYQFKCRVFKLQIIYNKTNLLCRFCDVYGTRNQIEHEQCDDLNEYGTLVMFHVIS